MVLKTTNESGIFLLQFRNDMIILEKTEFVRMKDECQVKSYSSVQLVYIEMIQTTDIILCSYIVWGEGVHIHIFHKLYCFSSLTPKLSL